METTKLSSKGQVVLPATIRAAHNWQAGLEFSVENTRDGVLLSPIKIHPSITLSDVLGCTNYKGKAHSVTEMDEAISAEIKTRHARG